MRGLHGVSVRERAFLAEAGLSEDDIDDLLRDNVIAGPDAGATAA